MNKSLIENLYYEVWNKGNFKILRNIITNNYVIQSDPGDSWEGKTLNRIEYEQRVLYTRTAFPDIKFELHQLVHEEIFIAVRWSANGTQRGSLKGIPATNNKLHFNGQTFYEMEEGLLSGHWQVIDRLGFIEQLRDTK